MTPADAERIALAALEWRRAERLSGPYSVEDMYACRAALGKLCDEQLAREEK